MNHETFNGWAEAAAAASLPEVLDLLAEDLAGRHLTARSKHGQRRAPSDPQLREEFRAVMVTAGIERAREWLTTGGDFYTVVGAAIRGAFDEQACAGGYA